MITPEEFVVRWGAEGLVSVPPSLIQAVSIPSPDQEFLIRAGLPRQVPIPSGNDFASLPIELPSPRQEADPKYPILSRYGQSSYLLLGGLKLERYDSFYSEMYFGVEGRTGRVGNVDPYAPFNLINSSISEFAYALLEYRDFREFYEQNWEQHPKRVRRRLREMEQSLKQSDPEAFASGGLYWPVWIYETELLLT